jgi:hypothetical protein
MSANDGKLLVQRQAPTDNRKAKTEKLKHSNGAAAFKRLALAGCHLCALLFASGFTQPGSTFKNLNADGIV